MLLHRTVVLSALLLVAVSAADDNAAEAPEGRRLKRGIFGKLMGRGGDKAERHNADSPDNGAILDEDEGYWERFMQATIDSIPSASPSAPPTPGPQCDVTVSA